MTVSYNIILPIILGILVILLTYSRNKNLSLQKVCYLFLLGPVIYGGFACFYFSLTGKLLFSDAIDSYRLWLALAGIVLIWMSQDSIRKELKKK